MKVRIFGTSNCKDCLFALTLIAKSKIEFEYVDANEDETQDFCDIHNVNELPHLQFLDEVEDVLMEHKGKITAEEFIQYLDHYSPYN